MHERDVNDDGVSAELPENSGNEAAAESTEDTARSEQTPVAKKPTKGGSGWKFAGGVLLGAVVFTGAMVALGVHWENADLSPKEPSKLELTRQNLAEQAARIDASAAKLLENNKDATVELVGLSAERYLDMLGGVWVPWPSGAPSGYTNPPVATAAPEGVTTDVLTKELTEFSTALLAAVNDVPDENRTEVLSAALGSQFLAMNLGGSSAPSCGDVDIAAAGTALAGKIPAPGSSAASTTTSAVSAAASTSRPAATTPLSTSSTADPHSSGTGSASTASPSSAPATASGDSSALRATDNARQWLETDAAAMPEESHAAQVARTEKFAALEEAILRAGAPDTREAYAPYPELKDGQTYTSQALRLTTSEILKAAAAVEGSDRDNLVALACSLHLSAAERASELPFPGAE